MDAQIDPRCLKINFRVGGPEFRALNSSNLLFDVEPLGDGAGEDIHFIMIGHGDEQLGFGDPGINEHLLVGRAAGDRQEVHPFGEMARTRRVDFDQG